MINDAELSLLARLCASAIRKEQCERPNGDLDWARLLMLARRHRVQGLAWLGLTGGAESRFPVSDGTLRRHQTDRSPKLARGLGRSPPAG